MRILVVGGTGFIGRHFIARLSAAGHRLLVPTRCYPRGRDLLVHPTVTLLECDVHREDALGPLLRESEAVVNLVGVLHGRRGTPYGPEFRQAHVELPRRLARACREHGVRRMLHVSALGAAPGAPSMYLRSKADGEAALREVFDAWPEGALTVFRPSVVFGPDDRLLNMFARLARWLPAVPLAGARARLQPVYVLDVARAMAAALAEPDAAGRSYALAGPRVYTLGELARLAAAWSGHPRRVWALPAPLGRLQAAVLECLPGPLMSRDNLDTLAVDSVSDEPFAPGLGIVPTPLEAVAPSWLRRGVSGGSLNAPAP